MSLFSTTLSGSCSYHLSAAGRPWFFRNVPMNYPGQIIVSIFILTIIIIIIISNGNRTVWSPIRSVIIRVINICLITSMITDRIGRHEVLLPINHNLNKICDIISYFLNQNTRNSKFCFASSEKKSHLSARDGAHCPIT